MREASDKPDLRWPEAMSKKTLAAYLDRSERAIEMDVAAGRMPQPIRLGASVRWRRQEINEWLERL